MISVCHYFQQSQTVTILDLVVDFVIILAPYRPMQGSTFIPTPKEIRNKEAILNI